MKTVGKCKRCGKNGYVNTEKKLCKKCNVKNNKEKKC